MEFLDDDTDAWNEGSAGLQGCGSRAPLKRKSPAVAGPVMASGELGRVGSAFVVGGVPEGPRMSGGTHDRGEGTKDAGDP